MRQEIFTKQSRSRKRREAVETVKEVLTCFIGFASLIGVVFIMLVMAP